MKNSSIFLFEKEGKKHRNSVENFICDLESISNFGDGRKDCKTIRGRI